ncbi:MAG: rhodanese-like domain-containing protein [Ignavibacteriota bacterium]
MVKSRKLIKPFWIAGVLGLLASLSACTEGSAQSYRTYSATEVNTFLKQDTSAVVLDVRTPDEYASETGHLKNSRLIPVQDLESRIGELKSIKNRTIVAYCRSGHRSKQASQIRVKQGFKVVNMDGGITAWNSKGLPIEKGVSQ